MMATTTEKLFVIDEAYEFSAPRFYDFMSVETEEEVRAAEQWFENALPHAPSPFMQRIKARRTVQPQILCDFGEQVNEGKELSEKNHGERPEPESINQIPTPQAEVGTEEAQKSINSLAESAELTAAVTKENVDENISNTNSKAEKADDVAVCPEGNVSVEDGKEKLLQGTDVCTPAPQKPTENQKLEAAKRIASKIKNVSAMTSKKSKVKGTKTSSARRGITAKSSIETPNLAHENPAVKRQKLEGGKTRQILTVNQNSNLPHKTRHGTVRNSSNFHQLPPKTDKEDRKVYVRDKAAPFVSMAEMMRKFQSSTREMSLSSNGSLFQGKPKLVLTRPKTPEFLTSQRARPIKVKSSAELEEEMMANIPKFKARPLNKKIFEATPLPPLPRTAPQPPRFKEFHLETMSRANHNPETSSLASSSEATTEVKSSQWKPQLSVPKSPCLQTYLRARPTKVKSSEELEKEALQNVPQFKARPLNKKIFESKGDMGIFCNMKKQVTIPQEFHFATDQRIPPQAAVFDLFDKLSISSEDKHFPTNTVPHPFLLYTEQRGMEKEKRLAMELMQKELEEERARVPRANPYPYTTDYPVVPPKPEPKPCTKPEPFQLESLLRHEEEMQREQEEQRRMEMEAAQMRIFRAQPILKDDPIPVPEKPRIPLTEVQGFELHVDHRAVDRAEFDKKIKEKEMTYKRYREEAESARLMEEEKELKQLRRTLVPHARPLPKFDNPFLPQKSDKGVTKAKSPKLRVDHRREKRRVVYPTTTVASTTSSAAAASRMR
ncbi:protein TPX2 isoform X2 [Andrographis paniculata]|uniref:protein TPX2 isoform X2 n=1 Tax=Andrographis paniculata TaxID=175694 RepID=UPI0021E7DC71|nr:protein TPX2 isoform X2 [Andrographis paniculata]